MALRNIVQIDQEKCNGCGECIDACAEGAIELIDGKATLVSEIYCDGLGACLGHCPQDAITVEQRQAEEFDEEATKVFLAGKSKKGQADAGAESGAKAGSQCPGCMVQTLERAGEAAPAAEGQAGSQLNHWPIQLMLVSPQAAYFKKADLLLAADCVPFAMGDFHTRLLAGRALAVGCPKLDDAELYIEKVADLIASNLPKSLTVVHMEVPCCSGLVHMAKQAIQLSGKDIPFKEVTVSIKGYLILTS